MNLKRKEFSNEINLGYTFLEFDWMWEWKDLHFRNFLKYTNTFKTN
jgi:hypothetical protein